MDHLKQKIETAIAESQMDAVLVVGVDNFNYMTRTVLPFAEHYPSRKAAALFPKEGSPVVVLPQDWSEAVKDQGWSGEVLVYDENQGYETGAFVKAMEELVVSMGLDKSSIGIDAARVSKGLMDSLSGKLPGVQWEPIDPMIRDYRGKTNENFKKIVEEDKGFIDGCDIILVNHIKPSTGTSMEILYAWERKKHVVIISQNDDVSPWLIYHSDKICRSLDEAIDYIKSF